MSLSPTMANLASGLLVLLLCLAFSPPAGGFSVAKQGRGRFLGDAAVARRAAVRSEEAFAMPLLPPLPPTYNFLEAGGIPGMETEENAIAVASGGVTRFVHMDRRDAEGRRRGGAYGGEGAAAGTRSLDRNVPYMFVAELVWILTGVFVGLASLFLAVTWAARFRGTWVYQKMGQMGTLPLVTCPACSIVSGAVALRCQLRQWPVDERLLVCMLTNLGLLGACASLVFVYFMSVSRDGVTAWKRMRTQ